MRPSIAATIRILRAREGMPVCSERGEVTALSRLLAVDLVLIYWGWTQYTVFKRIRSDGDVLRVNGIRSAEAAISFRIGNEQIGE